MRCTKTKAMIDDHADGLLPAREAEIVRDHLEGCPSCRDLAFAAKAASASLARWGDLEPPAGGFDGILARIEALPPESLTRPAFRPSRPAAWRRFAMPAGLAAAAAIVSAAVLSPHLRTVNPAAVAGGADAVVATAGTGLRPGEFYVARDPDDPALRRRPTFVRFGSSRPAGGAFPASTPFEEHAVPPLPGGFDDFLPVR